MKARLRGSWYVASGGIHVIPTYGASLGMARLGGGCDGALGDPFEAFEIVGVRPEVAFASPNIEDVVFIAEGTHAELPWLEELRSEPACLERDEPISLEGPWLGILGPHNETEVDLVPPYTLSMRVDDAAPRRYERSFITVHVGTALGMPLDQTDARDVIRQGGTVSVSARCRDADFWAEGIVAIPPA